MLDDLLLLRLWAAPDPARGEVRSRVAADLRPLTSDAHQSAGAWQTAFTAMTQRLAADDCLTISGRQGARLGLTEVGRQRVRDLFKISGEAASAGAGQRRRVGWAWWRDHHALPLALGGRGNEAVGNLRTALLQRLYLPELPVQRAAGSLQKTVDLLLAKRLKVSRVSLGAFREAALRDWIRQAPPVDAGTDTPPAAVFGNEPGRLDEYPALFAASVVAAAFRSPTGRFGEKKVFIAHVWRELLASGQAAPEQLDEFKRRLIRANTAGQLRLSRADLAGAHSDEDVRASEIDYLGEKFHFVRLD